MSPEELDTLVRRVQQGDKDGFADLFAATRRDVRIYLSAHASSADMVDEVLQAVFVACYEKIQVYELRGTFIPWLKGIAKNLLLKELHQRAKYVVAENDALESLIVEEGVASLREDEASRREDSVARLEDCLSKLTPRSRELIDHKYTRRAPIETMARSFRKSESWVAVTLFRIREALRTCMTKAELTT
ncbi:MAG TPA: sigma-70 family RNA polymerase sigma factor [Planctomycetota bacterium]|nr:sigma-70 family RNA polymerase sigma factor [Planctomycetota bacterium]